MGSLQIGTNRRMTNLNFICLKEMIPDTVRKMNLGAAKWKQRKRVSRATMGSPDKMGVPERIKRCPESVYLGVQVE